MTANEDRVSAWRTLLLAHSGALRAIEAELATKDTIPLSWYDVLLELNAAPDRRLRMQALAAKVLLSRTRVSRLVDELEREGLVARLPDPDDGRSTLATITAAGRRELRRTAPLYLAGIEQHFSSLFTASERAELTALLSRVADRHAKARAAS